MSFPNFEYFDKSDKGVGSRLIEGRVSSVEGTNQSFLLELDFGFGYKITIKSFEKRSMGDCFVVKADLVVKDQITIYDLNWTGPVRTAVESLASGTSFIGLSLDKRFCGLNTFVRSSEVSVKLLKVDFKKVQLGKRFKCFIASDGLSDYFVPLGGIRFYRSRGGGVSLIWFLITNFENWVANKSRLISQLAYNNQANQYFYYKSLQLTLYYKCLIRCLKYMPLKDLGFLKEYLLTRFGLYYNCIKELEVGANYYGLTALSEVGSEKEVIQKDFDLEFYHYYLKYLNNKETYVWFVLFLWFIVAVGKTTLVPVSAKEDNSFSLMRSGINPSKNRAHFLPVLVNQTFLVRN